LNGFLVEDLEGVGGGTENQKRGVRLCQIQQTISILSHHDFHWSWLALKMARRDLKGGPSRGLPEKEEEKEKDERKENEKLKMKKEMKKKKNFQEKTKKFFPRKSKKNQRKIKENQGKINPLKSAEFPRIFLMINIEIIS